MGKLGTIPIPNILGYMPIYWDGVIDE